MIQQPQQHDSIAQSRHGRRGRLRSHRRLMLTAWTGLGVLIGYAAFRLLVSQPDPAMTYAGRLNSCDAVRAAGLAPAAIGSPGYSPHLDADSDGIACEPWVGDPVTLDLPRLSGEPADGTVRVVRGR